MKSIKSVHHVAVVVSNMQDSLAFWRDALGMELQEVREVPAEASRVAFFQTAGCEIELVQPTTTDSGIAKFLAKRGPGMHHICLEVEDIAEALSRLKAKGTRLINEEARLDDHGRKYAFVHPESTGGVLVELYQA